ncbi:MAG: homoserine kinase [Zetaproteobacteria bacterium]|nr:homoserine kinase [Pseudobdellovibrionaceae bacterium]
MKTKLGKKKTARAFAPGSVGNIAVGFDLLGFSVDQVGDTVQASLEPGGESSNSSSNEQVTVEEVTGFSQGIPFEMKKNTAAFSVYKMLEDLNLSQEIYLKIEKGIPPGSGLGSSACSAVAAVVAVNQLLDEPLDEKILFEYALHGESLASGSYHGDNVGPSLLGGVVLSVLNHKTQVISLPYPERLYYVVVHPDFVLPTSKARAVLNENIALKDYVHQSGYLAQFITGLCLKDEFLIKESLKDNLFEPQRSKLIPGFDNMKELALDCGAFGFSISGAGPSVFSLTNSFEKADKIAACLKSYLLESGVKSQYFTGVIGGQGSKIF